MAAVCAAAAAGAALTGCEGDDDRGSGPIVVPAATTSAKAEPFADMTASELLDKAEQDMRDSGAMTYEISMTEDGSSLRVKGAATTEGACVAAMDMDGGRAQIIVPGGEDMYLKGDHDFWEQNAGPATARVFAGQWLKIPQSQFQDDDLSGMCDLDAIMDSVAEGDGADGTTVTKGAPTTLDGKQVIPLTQTDEDGGVAVIDVSTGATPYVVKVVEQAGDEPGFATFTDFGKHPRITVPPHARTVDPDDFGPGGGLHI